MSDCDGICSATIIYDFIKKISPNQPLIYFVHTGKQHGLSQSAEENIPLQAIENNVKLLIVPDAGSNNFNEFTLLKEVGIDTICLDHHEVTAPISERNENGIVINHHLGEGLNISLSGAGVSYQFVKAYCEYYDYLLGNSYLDLVATSIISDVCNMTSTENYAFVKAGFANITNPMLKAMYDEFNTRGNNPMGVSWGTAPKINAVFRSSDMEIKHILFKSMIGEYNIQEAVELLKENHATQSKIVRQVFNKIKSDLDLNHKVVIGYTDAENKGFTGLIANKLMGEYNKPALVLRDYGKQELSGSMRSPIEIANEITETGLAVCKGHLSSAGIELKKENLQKLIDWFDTLEISSVKSVACCIEPKDISLTLCKQCSENMLLWGGSEQSGVSQPKFYIRFETTPDLVTVFAKKTKTVKFEFGKASILKFMAKQDDVDLLKNNKCLVEAIVTLDVNEYNSFKSPQAKIENWEITAVENKELDWSDLF